MSVLEDRYRLVLGMLPSSYRLEWEEEMVATFLESMRVDDAEESEYLADFGRPSWSEVASVAALAARLRLGGVEAPPKSFLWGEAVRRVALVGLLLNAVTATVFMTQELWLGRTITWPAVPDEMLSMAQESPPDRWYLVSWLASLASVGAYVGLVHGKRGPAKVLAAVAYLSFLTAVSFSSVDAVAGQHPVEYSRWAAVVANAVFVSALAGFHCDAPCLPRRRWLLAFGIGVALTVVAQLVSVRQTVSGPVLFDGPGVACVAVVVAALLHLGARRLGRPTPTPAWSLALALLAVIALLQRLLSLPDYIVFDHPSEMDALLTMAMVESVMVLAALSALVVVATRSLRGLPEAGLTP